jgi:hypothetical protein
VADDYPTVLERDEPWKYPGYPGVSVRRLRVWRAGPGTVIAVLTEHAAHPGTSITNAAQAICLELERAYPAERVRVVEHYPDNPPGHRFSVVALNGVLHPFWRYLPDEQARALLPGVEDGEDHVTR